MPIVCGVKFRGTGKTYFFAPGDVQDLQINDFVIVETARGIEMGQIVMPLREVDESEIVGQLKPILRRATTTDLLDAQRFQSQEADAINTCKEQVARFNLPMKVTGAEYNYDGSRLTFFFTSEQRVDFRELVRELARIFKTRIELRQIGVRDEAKMCGGIGKCGRMLCCSTWLTEFAPVSIRMAKQQELPLSPMEISGLCGRLLCCLGYENDFYQQVKGKFPKLGERIDTPYGMGKVIKVSVLTETVSILLDDGSSMELTAEQLSGEEPIQPVRHAGLNEAQREALDRLTGSSALSFDTFDYLDEDEDEAQPNRSRSRSRRPRPAAEPPVQVSEETPEDADQDGDEQDQQSGRKRFSRRRRSRRKAEGPSDQPRQTSAPGGEQKNAPSQDDASTSNKKKRRRPRRRNKPQDQAGDKPVAPAAE
ncbi:MAG: stage 0 sporulation family protein [Chloroflexi bacterium]|jgi:cell fate regulator YaaT (PSP1 superfamily)|nr:stage 0 sporulation family protein [Chloroflexota bacterium]